MLKFSMLESFKILIGRNEKGNINLLDLAKKDDIWLHLKDAPSASRHHKNEQEQSARRRARDGC